jgi:integrase
MIGKITKVAVEKLQPGQVLWDTVLVGFGVRRQLKSPHYVLRYRNRVDGQQRFLSIGRHGMWTPDTARTEAQRLLGSVAAGIDPASSRSERAESFGATVDRYLTAKSAALKARSIDEVQRHLIVYAKPLHGLPLTKIDRRTVALRLGEIETASGGVSRNRFRSSLSAFFAWAIREGLCELNPVTGTGKANEGNGRDRVLSEPELKSLLAALDRSDFSDIVRLLLLTGQRRSEIGGLRWSEVKLDSIVLPADRTKNSREHVLPLSRQAMWIIDGQRQLDKDGNPVRVGEFVFGRKFTAWSDGKADLDKRLPGMKPWRIHDLRRTAATHMAELGVMPHVVEQILNHQSGSKAGIAGVYNKAKYTDAMRAALQTYGDYMDKLNPAPNSVVT